MSGVILGSAHRRNGVPGYLVSEDFDSGSMPPGWTTDGVGVVDFNNTAHTPSPQGGNLLRLSGNTNSSSGGAHKSLGGSYSDIWIYFLINAQIGNYNRNFYITDTTSIWMASGGPYWGGTSFSIPIFTWRHIWMHLGPSVRDIYVSSTSTRPAVTATWAGTFTAHTEIALSYTSGNGDGCHIDKLRVSTAEIGNDPI